MQTIRGKVIAKHSDTTVVVEVVSKTPHPMYRKLLKKSKKFKVDSTNIAVKIGDTVNIIKVRPISKDKHFKIMEVIA